MQASIKKEEDDFKAEHIFPIERRTKSCFNFEHKYKEKILSEPDMRDAHLWF